MRFMLSIVLLVSVVRPWPAAAQTDSAPAARKQAIALRVAAGSIRLDGHLSEDAWQRATPISDFVQKEPQEGLPPSMGMEVRILYQNDALYIGARMFHDGAATVQAPLGRRDEVEDQAEYILVSLDTFRDRLNAYGFGVSATGVRLDRYFRQDDEANFDEGFDPVWDAKAVIGDTSWTAELWIPLSQLRFNDQPQHVWGLNIQRSIPSRNEMDYWAPVPRTERGWASRFGDLVGIADLPSARRIEALPYVAAASTITSGRDEANPFGAGSNTGRAGVDFRMGLGPHLTLEATVNPDFGQVEADPAEVNLTALETFFTEKRPFFSQGANLLNMTQANNFFYSRRIGAPPAAAVSSTYVDYPSTSTILASAKLTGRLASGLSVGFLGAVTDEEFARTSEGGIADIGEIRVAPRVTYALGRVQQEFGRSGSTVGLMATAVHRDMAPSDPLASVLASSAFTAAGDTILRFAGGQYELRSYVGATIVNGESAALTRMQRSAVHYFQRPDKDYAPFDPSRTTLSGYKAGATFERTGGRHWLWNIRTDFESPGFESNDIGRVTSADGIRFDYGVRYRETNPGRLFRNYSIGVSQNNEVNYGGDRQSGSARLEAALTFLNFWTTTLASGPDFSARDSRLTRGGPLMATPRGWTTSASLRSRSAAKTVWNGSVAITTDEAGGHLSTINGGVSFRPGARWQFSILPTYIQQRDSQQYVTTENAGTAATFGRRYVFAAIDRRTLSAQFRLGYTFKPDLTLELYAEPFAASGRYEDFGQLLAPATRQRLLYGTDGTTVAINGDGSRRITDGGYTFTLANRDFNTSSFRSNLVLRWEWRPGSTLYAVWQQDRFQSEPIGSRVGAGDLFASLSSPGQNYFILKTSFWLPVW